MPHRDKSTFWTSAWAQQSPSFQIWARTLMAIQLLRSLITITSVTINNEYKLWDLLWAMQLIWIFCGAWKRMSWSKTMLGKKNLKFDLFFFLRELKKFPYLIWIILTWIHVCTGNVTDGEWCKLYCCSPLTTVASYS